MNEYKYDSRYGFLVSNLMPLNLLSLLISPLLFVIHDDAVLKRLNFFMSVIGYLPNAVAATVIFIVASTVMIPFAYIAALCKKIQLITQQANVRSFFDFIIFLIFGLLILAIHIPFDTAIFIA